MVSALATCPLCEQKIIITDEVEHSVNYSELSLELEDAVNDAIAEQAEADGWVDSYCPDCCEKNADMIMEQEREYDEFMTGEDR